MTVLDGLEPAGVWSHCGELTGIARPPKEEAEIREHVLARAEGHGFESTVDDEGNVVVQVPASEGRDDAPKVILQAHLDMVCEHDPDSRTTLGPEGSTSPWTATGWSRRERLSAPTTGSG